VAALLLLAPQAARAQRERTISSEPTCSHCTISLSPVVTLRSETAPDLTSSSIVVQRGADYLVAPVGDRSQIAVFGHSGRFGRAIGRAGEGPGEFENIRALTVLADGRLVVLDRRLTMLTAESRPLASRALPPSVAAFRMAALTDGHLVLNNYLPGQLPLCLFTPALELEKCFGGGDAHPIGDAMQRVLAVSPDGTFWAARQQYRYAIEHWDRSGHLLGTIARDVPWFPPTDPAQDPHALPTQVRPLPRVSGLWLDNAGHLWTAVLVPDAHWRATDSRPAGGGERRSRIPTPGEWATYFDTIVEVIDVRAGRVLTSRRFPGALGGFTRDGLLVELGEDGDGLITARLSRLAIMDETTRER
jgi:hypothetical protein